MGVIEKLAVQASSKLGESVNAASMVVPPGAALYKSFLPSSTVLAAGGAIASAFAAKLNDKKLGVAATMPRQMGVLAVTDDKVVFFKKRLVGSGCGHQLESWPLDDVTMTFEAPDKWKYPGVLLEFADGTRCSVFGEERWGLDRLASAVNA